MKRFLKVFVLLIAGLFALITGVDHALDRIASAPAQNSFCWYNEQGVAVVSYTGDLALCREYVKPLAVVPHAFLHRT
jgi:hypothetical protein